MMSALMSLEIFKADPAERERAIFIPICYLFGAERIIIDEA